jgi:PAS domain-containing protein
MLGRPFSDFVHPEDVPSTAERLRASVESGGRVESSARVYRRDGGLVEFEGTSIGITDDAGLPAGMLVLSRPAAEPARSGLRLAASR